MTQPSFIYGLPEHILIATLRKMNNIEICRIRRTCSYVDTFVEANRRTLANQPHLGFNVNLACSAFVGLGALPEEFRAKLTLSTVNDYGGERQMLVFREHFEADFEKKFSAIAMKKLSICFNGEVVPEAEEQLLAALRRCPLTCDWVQIFGITLANLIEVVDYVESRGKISIQMNHEEFNDATFGVLVAALKEKPRCNTFKVTINALTECTIDGLIETLKPFRAAKAMDCTRESFQKLLKEMQHSSGVGNLEKITCEFWDESIFAELFLPFDGPDAVPSTKLWDNNALPNEISVVDMQLEDGEIYEWYPPITVRVVELQHNYAVAVESISGAIWSEDIHFVPKDERSVLQKTIYELRLADVSQEFQDAYLAAREANKQEMLIEEYKRNWITGSFRKDNLF